MTPLIPNSHLPLYIQAVYLEGITFITFAQLLRNFYLFWFTADELENLVQQVRLVS
jgi:hypothetical protein